MDEAGGFVGWMERRVMPPLVKLAESPVVVAVQDGVMSSIPFIILGFLAYFFFPPDRYIFQASLPVFRDVAGGLFGAAARPHDDLLERALEAFNAGLGAMSMWASFRVAWKLARLQQRRAWLSGTVSVLVFALTFPLRPLGLHDLFLYLAHGGLFVALLLAWLMAVLEERFKTVQVRWGPGPKWVMEAAPALLAGACAATLVVGLNLILAWLSLRTDSLSDPLQINTLVYLLFQPLLTAGDSPLVFLVILSMILLTSMGVHGTGVVGSIVLPIWFALLSENARAAQLGQVPPHIVTPFFMHWCFMGGSGCTLPLCLMMFRARSPRLRKLARISILPSVCNVNETLTFGVPLIMNPMTVIPFLACPMLMCTLHYLELRFGLWHRTILYLPFVLPTPISMWLASGGDWRAFPIFAGDFVLCAAIWWPFFKKLDQRTVEQEAADILTGLDILAT
ncbi:MAG TPA: PTS transporter subunit EIIC [Candidatus Xenobia bacterium]